MPKANGKLFVTCERPGLIRGGAPNPAVKIHEVGAHTREQLLQLLNEPAISVHYVAEAVALTPENFGEVLGIEEPAADPAAAPAAKAAKKI